ncbi:EamA family transporter [Actinoplanes sp. NPDC089786]|uniref:EamA family transporter n=1 Tax=Actinoplanes sp. NPDC089786 TaxID=3155185 RepID=UPI0034300FF6
MRLGLLLALLSAATFGTSGIFARSLLDAGWSAGSAVAVRVGLGAVLLAIPALIAMRGRWAALRRSAGPIGLFGLLAIAAAQVGYFNAVQRLPIGVALLLEYSGILLVVLWMWAVHGQRPVRLTVAGAVTALAGLALVLDLTSGARFDPLGVMWGLIAAVGLAGYFVLSARVDPELPSIALASGGMAVGAVLLFGLGAAGLLPMTFTFGQVTLAGLRVSWLVPIAGLAVVAATIAYVAGIGAARLLGASLSSFVGLTEVLFAVLFAWLFVDELPTALQLGGGVLIIGGIVLVRLGMDRAGPDSTERKAPLPSVEAAA